jgi:lysophospholipase L1-like esterase
VSREPSRTVKLLLAAVAAALTAPATAAARHVPWRYVALGDSFAAAPGVPTQVDAGCQRSNHNYPSLVAAALHPASFKDVTCSSATTADVAKDQFSAVNRNTSLVTLTIGGNDVGFADIVTKCSAMGLFHPDGTPCRDTYTDEGGDKLDGRLTTVEPKVVGVLRAVRRRAPRARVLLVGYPRILPADHRGCRPRELFADGDLEYLGRFEDKLNDTLRHAAGEAGATFVDDHRAGTGHDICAPARVRWIESIFPDGSAVPFHPDARGERAMANAVLRRLRG